MRCLLCSVGRRVELLKDFRKSMETGSVIIATDNSPFAPALYFADRYYLAPLISDNNYIDWVLDICKKEQINAITTLIDPEIIILAKNRERFTEIGVEVLAPFEESANLCFNKYAMFQYLCRCGIRTPMTWGTYRETEEAIISKTTSFPLFVKPRYGSGSVGARKVNSFNELRAAFEIDSSLIAQEMMTGDGCYDMDADVYIDTVSHKPVAIFSKKKISTTIGGANKTISFKDDKLFDFINKAMSCFDFNGPVDVDIFYKDGEYYLSEINPRFGGAYLHAYAAGVDFIKLLDNNLKGIENKSIIGEYEQDVVMMMYDSVYISKMGDNSMIKE